MKRYFFLHPDTLATKDIFNGRSLWEDSPSKSEFIVVKEIGPAMDHWKEAMESSLFVNSLLDDIRTALHDRGYSKDLIQQILVKIKD
jgi:hypothetical protein